MRSSRPRRSRLRICRSSPRSRSLCPGSRLNIAQRKRCSAKTSGRTASTRTARRSRRCADTCTSRVSRRGGCKPRNYSRPCSPAVGWAKRSVPTTTISDLTNDHVGTALRAFAHPTALIVMMMVVPVVVMAMLMRMGIVMFMIMVMQPLARPRAARVLAEDERLDRHRHGVGRHADAAEVDVVEVPQHDAVDDEKLAGDAELVAQDVAGRLGAV